MARVVRGPLKVDDLYTLPAMPLLNDQIATQYERLFPERSRQFSPPNERELIAIQKAQIIEYTQHHLRHEAESIFWNLLFWVMTAQPTNKTKTDPNAVAEGFKPTVLPADWGSLVSHGDSRNKSFIASDFEKRLIHPAYSPIYTLLDEMRRHLRGDLELSKDKLKKRPDYLHEVFQRLIINFLAKNSKEPFMNLKRSKDLRQEDPSGMKLTSSGAVSPSNNPPPITSSQPTSASGASSSRRHTGVKREHVVDAEGTSGTGPVS